MQTTALDSLVERARRRRALPAPEEARAIRESARLSQRDIATAIGVTVASVSGWELGEFRPSGERLDRYAELLARLREELDA